MLTTRNTVREEPKTATHRVRIMPRLRDRKLSNRIVAGLCVGDRGTVFWDPELPGFGVRVYPSGARVYVVQTRSRGRSRRVTVGRHGVLSAARARRRAALIIARIKAGEEPLPARVKTDREAGSAVTVTDLARRYFDQYAAVRCKPSTLRCYRSALARQILPSLGDLPARAVEREDVAALHHRLRETPYRANQVLHILNKMFALAEVWGLREPGSHPVRSIRKYREHKRERFLSEEEFRRLGRVLHEAEAEAEAEAGGKGGAPIRASAVAALRLLMLTGCRRNEVLDLKWKDVDRKAGELRLRDSKTGARAVPLPPAAGTVLAGVPRVPGNPWVITGARPGGRLSNLNDHWLRIRARAGLEDVRIHDLRHSFASRALALGESLPMIARLLGHGQAHTIARYAHLARDAVKASASRVAGSIAADMGKHSVEGGR